MRCHIRKKALTLLPVACLIMYLLLIIGSPDSAHASIHKYPESSTKVMYRSQQSLRDNLDGAWQAVLFKRLNSGHLESLHLRLVGFPGTREVAHPKPLLIVAGFGKGWTADDAIAQSVLPANVGEYDLLEVITQLDKDIPLRLGLPLKDGRQVELLVPPFVIREWRMLMSSSAMGTNSAITLKKD